MPFCTNCGEKGEENQQVCAKCGITLTSTEATKPSIKFLVPLNHSDVRTVIPGGDEIIYSAVFNVAYINPAARSPYPEEFLTHVLFTKRGIAYQAGALKVNEYLPWALLGQIYVGGMMVKKKMSFYNFMLHTDPTYETPEEFKMRPWKFYFEYGPHVISEKKRCDNTSNLKKMEKMYYKFVDVLGEEEIEFIRDNDDFEEFEKDYPQLREAMLKAVPKIARPFIKRSELFPM